MATASFQLSVKADVSRALKSVSETREKIVLAAAARALNRTATTLRAEAARQISTQLGLKVSAVKRGLFINKAAKHALVAQIVAVGKRGIPLRDLHPRQTDSGVTVRGGTLVPTEYPHAFIVEALGRHVFERVGKKRLPIRRLYGASIPSAFSTAAVRQALNTIGAATWKKNFEHELQHRLLD